MTAQEFGEWMVFLKREQLHPAADRLHRAQALAALHNGPWSRSDKRLWQAADLMPADPWAAPPPPAEPLTTAALRAQVAAINSAMRGRDV